MTLLLTVLLLQDPVRDAVKRGVEHLKYADGSDDLVAWTLVSAEVPWKDAALDARLKRILGSPPATTSQAALRAMTLERLDARKFREALRHCAQFLADNQAVDGLWGEGSPIDPVEPSVKASPIFKFSVKARRAGPAAGDVANARWAAEGLLACDRAGALFPEKLLERAAEAWRVEGRDAGEVAPALATLLHLQTRNFMKDPDVIRAGDRLLKRATPTDPWGLYELKRTSILLNRDLFPDCAAAERALLAAQKPDGSWGTARETCGAVLFLWRRDLYSSWPK